MTVDILRDDLIHPIVSGNKWRKLKLIADYLVQEKIKHIVTFGGAYSNHLVAVSFICNYLNIKSTAFVRGDEVRIENKYESICKENNMTLRYISREEYRNKEKLYLDNFGSESACLMLAEGGDHPLAIESCSAILDDIKTTYDYIILSLGTGTTMEGLVKGIVDRNWNTQIIGISSLKNNFYLDKRLEKYPKNKWQVLHDYHRGKYGKMDAELIDFIIKFNKDTSIKLEPIYTGKMFLAVKDLILNNFFKPSDKILLIHTGGLLAYPE